MVRERGTVTPSALAVLRFKSKRDERAVILRRLLASKCCQHRSSRGKGELSPRQRWRLIDRRIIPPSLSSWLRKPIIANTKWLIDR